MTFRSDFRGPDAASLYAILDLGYVDAGRAEDVTSALLAGGAGLLQLRAKGHGLETIREVAGKLLPLCRAAGVPFILNDYPELAGGIGADGVHIGQDDGSLSEAREAFRSASPGSRYPSVVGRSTHSLEQARTAMAEGFDYLGFGPLFPTPTKLGRPGIGLSDVRAVQTEVGTRIPVFCIGGIKRSNLAEVLSAGARNLVIVSDLLGAGDVEAAAAEVVKALLSAQGKGSGA